MNLLIELVAVIVGIYIALNIDQITQSERDNKTEQGFLISFIENMETDLEQLNYLEHYYASKIADTKTIISLLEKENTDFNLVDSLHAERLTPKTFFPTKGAYTSIISSGQLALIKNNQIRIDLSNLYDRFMYRIEYNSTIIDNVTFKYFDYLEQYYDFENNKFIKPLNKEEKERLKMKIAYVNLYTSFYRDRLNDAHTNIRSTIALIKEELNKFN